MRVVQVPVRTPSRPRHLKRRLALFLVLAALAAGAANYLRPLPPSTISLQLPQLPGTHAPALSWPAYGQAAVGAADYSVLASNGPQTPLAMASIAKVITALCVLQKHPIAPGQAGPTLTIGQADMAIYSQVMAQNGSLVPVTLGEQLSEYQALQALMLPSANNIADSLVLWAFGSQSAYVAYASQFLLQNELINTHIGIDASGFDPSTTSTATDLTKLGLLATNNPVLMEIAGQKSAVLPVAGTVRNYDTVLGQNGITGLKTGNSDADPGAFLFTALVPFGSTQLSVAGTVMGAPDLDQALQSAATLASSTSQAFEQVTALHADQTVGTVRSAWGAATPVVNNKALQLVRWKGTALTERHNLQVTNDPHQTTLGSLELSAGPVHISTTLRMAHPLAAPSFWWRLTRH